MSFKSVDDYLAETEELQRRKRYLLMKDWTENVYNPLKVTYLTVYQSNIHVHIFLLIRSLLQKITRMPKNFKNFCTRLKKN